MSRGASGALGISVLHRNIHLYFSSSSKKNSWFWWMLYVAPSMFSGAVWVRSSMLHGQWMGREAPAGKAPGEGTTKLQGARWRCGVSREAQGTPTSCKSLFKSQEQGFSVFLFFFLIDAFMLSGKRFCSPATPNSVKWKKIHAFFFLFPPQSSSLPCLKPKPQ